MKANIPTNDPKQTRQFKISYCYGGRYKGECKLEKIIEAKDENEARDKFNAAWHSEEIYSIIPVEMHLPESDVTLDGLRTLRNDMNVAKLIATTAIIELSSCGNPDYRQKKSLFSPKLLKPCTTFADAVKLCRDYISEYELGGGNWNGGFIYHPTKGIIARISYNGRVWEATDKNLDYRNPSKEITEINLTII